MFDATSARAHVANAATLAPYGKVLVDLTPAAIGPFVVPAVNLERHRGARNVNMVTCGGQATIPRDRGRLPAGAGALRRDRRLDRVALRRPRHPANLDEFTETTAKAIEDVGGADRGKAIIVLNPADPPMIMRDTVLCLVDDVDPAAVGAGVDDMVAQVAR